MHQGLPPTTTNCTENCLLYRWLRSACQCVKKMNRSQAGDGFFLPPSFTFSVNLDFNSQKKKGIRDTPKQLISTLISQFCFTLKSTSFSQEETGVGLAFTFHLDQPAHLWLYVRIQERSLFTQKGRAFLTTTWQKRASWPELLEKRTREAQMQCWDIKNSCVLVYHDKDTTAA